MRFTISGFWTAIIIVAILTLLLYIITRSPRVYKIINPNIIILFTILVILRVLIPLELRNAKGVFLLKVVPEIDTVVRYPLLTIGTNTIKTWMILALIWGSVASIKIYIMMRQYFSMRKQIHLDRPLSKDKMSIVRFAEKEMGVRGKIQYRVSRKYTSPFIFGVLKSIVVLPSAIENLHDEQICMMLYHELSHHNRRDCITKILFNVFSCVFWCLPCMKPLMEKLDEAVEIRADWQTIRKMSEEQKTEYLKVLYSMTEITKNSYIPYANMFINGQMNTIEKRFRFISGYKKWRWSSLLTIIGMMVFILSYMFIIEPKHLPSNGGISCKNSCTIYVQQNGEYEVYMDEIYLGNLKSIDFLDNENFKDINVKIMEDKYE